MDLLKNKVFNYWNKSSCGTEITDQTRYSKDYFEDIENFRYSIEPEIFSFAQFTRFHNKKVLEVGVGAGTDFLQWVRSGAEAYGIDLTKEAIINTKERLQLYGLKAVDLKVADAENIPYPDNYFDCVYSWGVIHHSPDTIKCLKEIIRVTRPGGVIKIMIYNRRSLFAFYQWIIYGLLKGKFLKSLKTILFEYQESPGTKAYTFKEVKKMLKGMPIILCNLKATTTNHDLLYYKSKSIQFCAKVLAGLLGWNKIGWFMTLDLQKQELI